MGIFTMVAGSAFAAPRVGDDLVGGYELTNARYGLCEPHVTARVTGGLDGTAEVWIAQFTFAQDRTIREDRNSKTITTNRYRPQVILQETLFIDKINHKQETTYVYVKWDGRTLWLQNGVRNEESSLRECFYKKVSNNTP